MFFSVISYVNIQTHCDHILPNALNKLRNKLAACLNIILQFFWPTIFKSI